MSSGSIAFFSGLGFAFNQQFTDDSATCMILSEEAYVMLLVEKRFKDFTRKQLCDTHTHTEALLRESFADMEFLDLRSYDADLTEGTQHRGMSALIGLVARKR